MTTKSSSETLLSRHIPSLLSQRSLRYLRSWPHRVVAIVTAIVEAATATVAVVMDVIAEALIAQKPLKRRKEGAKTS